MQSNSNNPTVSVIIPTVNRRALIMDAVESVLGQGVENVEVVVDDGSTDGTGGRTNDGSEESVRSLIHVFEGTVDRTSIVHPDAARVASKRLAAKWSHLANLPEFPKETPRGGSGDEYAPAGGTAARRQLAASCAGRQAGRLSQAASAPHSFGRNHPSPEAP